MIIQKSPPERVLREQTDGQSVQEIQIVYNAESNVNKAVNIQWF